MNTKGTALITGAAKRIGKSIALCLAAQGYDIALHYNSSSDEAHAVADQIRAGGCRCNLFRCDFLQSSSIPDFCDDVFSCCPDTTVLINSASIFERANLQQTTEELFDRHFQVNFKVPFFLSQQFALRVNQGHILNIVDTKAARTLVQYFAYTLTKKTLFEFTKMAAKELAPHIRVNGIGPGLILPPPGEDDAYLQQRAHAIPLLQKGDVEYINSAVLFFLNNPYVTGECIMVDGGEHLK
jgi:pteridine reductase